MTETTTTLTFSELGLPDTLLSTLTKLGYETPTPIQERSIPVLIEGKDLLAQAQTGTGKTAAFALPILANIDLDITDPQAIIIAPTRELAIQVAEALQSYAKGLKDFHVTPIYGGQDYKIQLRSLKRGTHVIVGTPGRIMDHLRRGTIKVENIKNVVLDEADEMLKMGFIDDIEWILEQIPNTVQTALFSATLPASVQKIAKRYLKDAEKIQIKSTSNTVDAIEQVYCCVNNNQKMDVLTRFLEVEDVQAAIIFSRTKTGSAELAEKLQARGYTAAALNGDMKQSQREKTLERIKKGHLDIIVATDVAARGIDVERVSHVINYDIPHDTKSYVHRIGRTGRAGRKGKALLFVTPRERRLLKDIEKAINKPITQIDPPTVEEMTEIRSKQLAETVVSVIEKSKKLKPYLDMVESIATEHGFKPANIAAALAYLVQQDNELPSHEVSSASFSNSSDKGGRSRGKSGGNRGGRSGSRERSGYKGRTESKGRSDSRGSSDSRGRSNSRGSSDSRGRSDSRGNSDSRGRSDSRGNSDSRGRSDSRGNSDSRSRSDSKGSSDSRSRSDSKGRSDSKKTSDTKRATGQKFAKPTTAGNTRAPRKT